MNSYEKLKQEVKNAREAISQDSYSAVPSSCPGMLSASRCSRVVSCDIPKILTDIDALMQGGAK